MDIATALPPPAPTDEPVAPVLAAGLLEIDPEDEQVVPAAFARLVEAALFVLWAVEVTGIYTPQDAVITVEQTTAVLYRLSGNFDLYVGDFSTAAGKSMGRARDLLRQARVEISDARNHLTLDDQTPKTPPPAAAPGKGAP